MTTNALATGSRAITARYGGNATFGGSVSPTLLETISKAATTTIVTSSANPALPGRPVTLTATVDVSPPGTGTPTGAVTFLDGVKVLGSGILNTSRKATLTTSALALGSHAITARFGGTVDLAASTSDVLTETVAKATSTTTLTSSANPAVSGQSVVLTATVDVVPSGAGAPTGVVTFREGATVLGTGTLNAARQATFTTNTLAIGAHPITASYPGAPLIDGSTSDVLTETVTKAASTTTLTASANPAVSGQPVVLTATVNVVPPGVATPTGVVTFLEGATVLGAGVLNGARQATFTIGTLTIGAHEITASYPGAALIDASTSAPLTETISKASTATTLTSSANPSVLGGSVTFTATVNVLAPGAGTPTGTVTFMDGATVLGSAPLNGARQATAETGFSPRARRLHRPSPYRTGNAPFLDDIGDDRRPWRPRRRGARQRRVPGAPLYWMSRCATLALWAHAPEIASRTGHPAPAPDRWRPLQRSPLGRALLPLMQMRLHQIALGARRAACIGLFALAAGCSVTRAPAPDTTASVPSLTEAKRQVSEYVSSGRYDADIAEAVAQARSYLTTRVARGGMLAIVLDIDETSVSNLPALRANDYGFIVAGPCGDLPRGPCGFLAWIMLARAEPIRPVLELTRFARAQGVAVFFLTGRPERLRTATEANLKAAGYEWTGVLLKPDALNTPSAVAFKAAERKKLVEQGYVIVVNVGDQMSDLDGGYSERTYKLPNPFYFVP